MLPAAAALAVFTGCERASTPGGPGAPAGNKPVVGQADDSFSLDLPNLATKIKQGESKVITIGIKRGKNFDQDVTIKFDNVPKGLAFDAPAPVLKRGETETKFTAMATDDAAIGDFVIKTTGQPARGAAAQSELKVTIDKK
jgi:uncharacterized membrane protein